jgi:hypothetical protein
MFYTIFHQTFQKFDCNLGFEVTMEGQKNIDVVHAIPDEEQKL